MLLSKLIFVAFGVSTAQTDLIVSEQGMYSHYDCLHMTLSSCHGAHDWDASVTGVDHLGGCSHPHRMVHCIVVPLFGVALMTIPHSLP